MNQVVNTNQYIVIYYDGDINHIQFNPINGYVNRVSDKFDIKLLRIEHEVHYSPSLFKKNAESKVIWISPYLDVDSRNKTIKIGKNKSFEYVKNCKVCKEKEYSWGLAITKVDKANRLGLTGENLNIAILDDGFKKDQQGFKDLSKNGEIVFGNFYNSEVEFSKIDGGGHCIPCAGIICGDDLKIIEGVRKRRIRIGIAKGIKKLIIGKVSEKRSVNFLFLLKGILWSVIQGADVVSMSLGISFPKYYNKFVTEIEPGKYSDNQKSEIFWYYNYLIRTIDFLVGLLQVAKSTVFVSSAGNNSNPERTQGGNIGYSRIPGISTNILCIGALTYTDILELDSESNRGVNLVAPGDSTCSVNLEKSNISFEDTSAATPHAAGIILLWKQLLLDKEMFNIERLMSCIRQTSSSDGLTKYSGLDIGMGLIQAPCEESITMLETNGTLK